MPQRPAIPVAVVIERHRQPNAWQDWTFDIVEIVRDEGGFGDQPRTLRDDGIAWWKTQLEQGRIRRGGEPPAAAPATPQDRDDE